MERNISELCSVTHLWLNPSEELLVRRFQVLLQLNFACFLSVAHLNRSASLLLVHVWGAWQHRLRWVSVHRERTGVISEANLEVAWPGVGSPLTSDLVQDLERACWLRFGGHLLTVCRLIIVLCVALGMLFHQREIFLLKVIFLWVRGHDLWGRSLKGCLILCGHAGVIVCWTEHNIRNLPFTCGVFRKWRVGQTDSCGFADQTVWCFIDLSFFLPHNELSFLHLGLHFITALSTCHRQFVSLMRFTCLSRVDHGLFSTVLRERGDPVVAWSNPLSLAKTWSCYRVA